MRFILRGIGIGLLAGSLFFFFPFLFRFLLVALLIFFIIRLVFGWGWRRRYYGWRSFHPYDRHYDDNIISIDGRGYVPPVQGKNPESHFPVQ